MNPLLQLRGHLRFKIKDIFHPSGNRIRLACAVVKQDQVVFSDQLRIVRVFKSRSGRGKSEVRKWPTQRPDNVPGLFVNPDNQVHVAQAQQDVSIVQGLECIVVISVQQTGLPVAVRAPSWRNVLRSSPRPNHIAHGVLFLDQAIDQ